MWTLLSLLAPLRSAFLYYIAPWMTLIWALCTSSVPPNRPFLPARKIRTRLVTFEWYSSVSLMDCLVMISFLIFCHSVAWAYQMLGLHNFYEAWQLAGYHSSPTGICEVTATQQMADGVHWIVAYRDIMGTQVHVQKVPYDSPYVDPRLLGKGSTVPCYDYDYYHYNAPYKSTPKVALLDQEQLSCTDSSCSEPSHEAAFENQWPIVIAPPQPISLTTFYMLFLSILIELLICLFFLRSGPIFFYRVSLTNGNQNEDQRTEASIPLGTENQEEPLGQPPRRSVQEVFVQALVE